MDDKPSMLATPVAAVFVAVKDLGRTRGSRPHRVTTRG
jgi:hypothetical protein